MDELTANMSRIEALGPIVDAWLKTESAEIDAGERRLNRMRRADGRSLARHDGPARIDVVGAWVREGDGPGRISAAGIVAAINAVASSPAIWFRVSSCGTDAKSLLQYLSKTMAAELQRIQSNSRVNILTGKPN